MSESLRAVLAATARFGRGNEEDNRRQNIANWRDGVGAAVDSLFFRSHHQGGDGPSQKGKGA